MAESWESGMLNVLSIQSDIIGNKTYSTSLREHFASANTLKVDSYWYNAQRSIPTRLINKLASLSIPLLDSQERNLDLRRARVEWSYGRTSRLLTGKLLSNKRYQLLHFHTQIQAYGSIALMKRIPTIITTDMTAALASRQATIRFPGTYGINVALDRRAFRAAAHTVVFTEWAKRSLIEDYCIAPGKVSVIPPGSGLDHFSEPSFVQRSRPKLLFIGGDFKRKGGWDVLDVFTRHFKDDAELHLVTGERLANLPESVFVHNGISPYTPEWHDLIRESDILVVPSYAEPYGLVFQEAGGYGLALIGGRVGGIPEIIVDGETGFLVTPGRIQELKDAIGLLISDPTRLATMRRQSREVALERFSAKTNMNRLAECFVKVYRETTGTVPA